MWSRAHLPIPLVDPERLQFCIKNGLNVLLQGKHGVGKTTLVRQAFQQAGLNLLVFSGPTMDPWVDFVGVPRPVKRKDGKTVLELIRRPELSADEVDGIFIDEFNRAPSKVRNAAMELLQFRSVNGHQFNRLRSVWAAINPGDDRYDADELDPAQLDRFHVKIEVPYKPCPHYFLKEFGGSGKAALEWWDIQTAEAQSKVSPRRLEYAVRIAGMGGPVRDVLPPEANVKLFMQMLEDGPLFEDLRETLAKRDYEAGRRIMHDPANCCQALRLVLGSQAASEFFLPLLDTEKIMSLLGNPTVLETVVKYSERIPEFRNAVILALQSDPSRPLFKKTQSLVKSHKIGLNSHSQLALVPLDSKPIASALASAEAGESVGFAS